MEVTHDRDRATRYTGGKHFRDGLHTPPCLGGRSSVVVDRYRPSRTGNSQYTNTYFQGSRVMRATIAPCAERTATGPIGQIGHMSAESAAEAIMEIRRRSGLTWEELGDLFEVSRRSVHYWASGKSASARHDRVIRRMLAAVRHLDRGDRELTRALLLSVGEGMGVSIFDLLRGGRFHEAIGLVEGVPALERQSILLSSTAWEARRAQAPVLLLEAEQDRPDISAKARVVRPKQTPRRTG